GPFVSGVVELTPEGVSAADVVAVAREDAAVALGSAARAEMERSAAVVAARADAAAPAYGISPGFGSLALVRIPASARVALQRSLIRSHASGMGPAIERDVVRAMMLLPARWPWGARACGRWSSSGCWRCWARV